MKNLLASIISIFLMVTACAPKEKNAVNTTTPVRGAMNNGQLPPGTPRKAGPQTAVAPSANDQQVAALERFSKDLGFFPLKDSNIPKVVQNAAASIFQVRFLVVSSDKSYANYKKSQLKDEKFAAQELGKIKDPFNRMVVEKQLVECVTNQSIADDGNCGLIHEINQGTAFLAGDGKTLWTNAHTIEGFVKSVEKNQKITIEQLVANQHAIRVFIFDSNNDLVVNPYTSKVTIAQLPAATRSMTGDKYYSVDNDYIILNLEKELGPALTWSKRGVAINHQVYIPGYAYCTGCAAPERYKTEELKDLEVNFTSRSPAPDSKGRGLVVTKGIAVMGDNTVLNFVKFPDVKTESIDQNKMIYMTADGQVGMSGAPILDKRGEVIGVFSGGATAKIKDKLYRISGGVIPSGILTDQGLN